MAPASPPGAAALHPRVLASSVLGCALAPAPWGEDGTRAEGWAGWDESNMVVVVVGLLHGPVGTPVFGEAPLFQGSGVGVLGST